LPGGSTDPVGKEAVAFLKKSSAKDFFEFIRDVRTSDGDDSKTFLRSFF